MEGSNENEKTNADSDQGWVFDPQVIHPIQIKEMSEFFEGKGCKTPQLYKKYRNFIVRLYKMQPSRYLTKIACRRSLRGDANAIMRLHKFLSKHRIINQQVDLCQQTTFNRNTIKKLPWRLSNLKPMKRPKHDRQEQWNPQTFIYNSASRILSKASRSFCVKCGILCGLVFFNRKQSTSQTCICESCYMSLEQPSKQQYDRTDVTKRLDPGNTNRGKLNWPVEQNFKMIEAISENRATWSSLYDKMGYKRTKEDIIANFLQFPILNTKASEETCDDVLPLSMDEQLEIIKEQYQSSMYKEYDMSGENEKLFKIQPVSDDLKTLISLQLQKHLKRLQCLERVEQLELANECRSNVVSLVNQLRQEQRRPVQNVQFFEDPYIDQMEQEQEGELPPPEQEDDIDQYLK